MDASSNIVQFTHQLSTSNEVPQALRGLASKTLTHFQADISLNNRIDSLSVHLFKEAIDILRNDKDASIADKATMLHTYTQLSSLENNLLFDSTTIPQIHRNTINDHFAEYVPTIAGESVSSQDIGRLPKGAFIITSSDQKKGLYELTTEKGTYKISVTKKGIEVLSPGKVSEPPEIYTSVGKMLGKLELDATKIMDGKEVKQLLQQDANEIMKSLKKDFFQSGNIPKSFTEQNLAINPLLAIRFYRLVHANPETGKALKNAFNGDLKAFQALPLQQKKVAFELAGMAGKNNLLTLMASHMSNDMSDEYVEVRQELATQFPEIERHLPIQKEGTLKVDSKHFGILLPNQTVPSYPPGMGNIRGVINNLFTKCADLFHGDPPPISIYEDDGKLVSVDYIDEGLGKLIENIEKEVVMMGVPKDDTHGWYQDLKNLIANYAHDAHNRTPEDFARFIGELGIAGHHCGGRWMGYASKMHSLKSVETMDFRSSILVLLARYREELAETIASDGKMNNNDVHRYNFVLKSLVNRGVSQTTVYEDPLQPKSLTKKQIQATFDLEYTPKSIVDRLMEDIHAPGSILNAEFITDYLKDNVPLDFNAELYDSLRKLSGTELKEACEKHGVDFDPKFTIDIGKVFDNRRKLIQDKVPLVTDGPAQQALKRAQLKMLLERHKNDIPTIKEELDQLSKLEDERRALKEADKTEGLNKIELDINELLAKLANAVVEHHNEDEQKLRLDFANRRELLEANGIKVPARSTLEDAIKEHREHAFREQAFVEGHLKREVIVDILKDLGIVYDPEVKKKNKELLDSIQETIIKTIATGILSKKAIDKLASKEPVEVLDDLSIFLQKAMKKGEQAYVDDKIKDENKGLSDFGEAELAGDLLISRQDYHRVRYQEMANLAENVETLKASPLLKNSKQIKSAVKSA